LYVLAAKSKVADLRAHFKNTYNTALAVKGLRLKKAIAYMDNVLEHKAIIGFRKFSVSRHAQCKVQGTSTGRWPEKSAKAVRELLLNLKANAEKKGLDTDKCVITHVVV
jgi:large subunit ribosomal protein L17e